MRSWLAMMRGGRATCEQFELLADAVLGLATGAVQVLGEGAGIGHAGVFERGDDESRGLAPSGVGLARRRARPCGGALAGTGCARVR